MNLIVHSLKNKSFDIDVTKDDGVKFTESRFATGGGNN
jgi:hypothetical protein